MLVIAFYLSTKLYQIKSNICSLHSIFLEEIKSSNVKCILYKFFTRPQPATHLLCKKHAFQKLQDQPVSSCVMVNINLFMKYDNDYKVPCVCFAIFWLGVAAPYLIMQQNNQSTVCSLFHHRIMLN